LEYLSKTDLFCDLRAEEIRELDRMTVMHTCRPGTVFYEPDQAFEVLFILKHGHVNLYRLTAEGRKLITATVGPGTIFGEMSLIGQSMRASYAEAVDECLICRMSPTDLERLILSKPAVALRLVELLSRRVLQLETRLERMAFRDVPSRLAAVLLELASPDGAEILGVSHQDLADMVGTSRETITRILDEWRLAGAVELERMRIAVHDRAALQAIANG
jgi:CRP-like cAMP-binding protein